MDASSNRVETVYLDAGEYVVEGSIRRADLTGAVHAIPNRAATVVTVQRACNGCGRDLRDATKAECEAAISGAPLPDVRSQCPDCSGHATRNSAATIIRDRLALYEIASHPTYVQQAVIIELRAVLQRIEAQDD